MGEELAPPFDRARRRGSGLMYVALTQWQNFMAARIPMIPPATSNRRQAPPGERREEGGRASDGDELEEEEEEFEEELG